MDRVVTKRSSSSHNRGISMIRSMIMGIVMIVFLGYLMIWVLTPTNIYRQNWLPSIRLKANSTYFGAQGPTMLIYTFPILFMAVFGSVYLHMKKLSEKNMECKKHRLATWRRPVIIKWLGIVSWIELAFFLMFIALLVWSFSVYLYIGFGNITPQTAAKSHEKVWESKLESVGLRFGLIGNIVLAFLFFPVTRGSTILPLFGLTSEASIKYHIWMGHIIMTLFTAHGVCYTIYWAITHQASELLKWEKTGVSNVAGELSLVCGLVLWGTTFPQIRRKIFELFFYTHHLYIPFMIFFVFHVGISYASIMLPGFYLFLVDRYLRFLQSRQGVRLVSSRILPCDTLELNFSKSQDLSYTPTSIMFVKVSSISKVQWHPFTISSSSTLEPEKMSVIIKSEGSWSTKLYHMLSSPNSVDRIDVSIEGPYGPASTDFLRHDTLVMVSGGSGITPFISIFRDLLATNSTANKKQTKIILISTFKNSSDLTMLDLLLPISGTPFDLTNLDLQIEAYVTREKQPTTTDHPQKSPRTLWFKPNPSDTPVSPILGPNSTLWLGMVISASFILFLILMGILTRYYIYPIDHNTNKVFSYSTRAVLNMLLMCFSIAAAAGAAFVWNKKESAMEAKQVQSMEGATPAASPNTGWCYNADRELESFPQQSLVQSTIVHYGERPDLKKILFERKESSVGVLVCGPKKMRHDVAGICSSGLTDNLHFESISFSW